MTEMTYEKQNQIIDMVNDSCYLLSMHIESNFKEIVAEDEFEEDYITEVAVIQFPKTDKKVRNVKIASYFTKEMRMLDMIFVKLEKTCFNGQIYYNLCYKEMKEDV